MFLYLFAATVATSAFVRVSLTVQALRHRHVSRCPAMPDQVAAILLANLLHALNPFIAQLALGFYDFAFLK